ncbi:hypothetical protein ACFC0R_10310 [Streptomyces sp. NPDC056086]|uniref:hypothetical protein n=1 Tax=Streptomyces sp. NPDC056086 TaxID=3345709 RepID=UPI0035D853AE
MTEPGREGLPLIDLAAARVLFRTAESSGLGRPRTDEIFDQWLDSGCDIAFYRNADRPLQARAVDMRDEVPEWLDNTRTGKARLEAVCLNPRRTAPSPSQEPASASTEVEAAQETTDAEEMDTRTCRCMPGLCWCDGVDEERYAKVENPEDREDVDGGCVLEIVNAVAGGMGEDPSYDLSGELPPDFDRRSALGLMALAEVAQTKLDAERWETVEPWRLRWSSCVCDVTGPLHETTDTDSSGGGLNEQSGETSYYVSIRNNNARFVEIIQRRGGFQHVMHSAPMTEPNGASLDPDTPEELRSLLERAKEQVREAGYAVAGDWTVDWSLCQVRLTDLEYHY